MNRSFTMVVEKLFKVIDSMDNLEHMVGVRNYIDLYYRMYGTQYKGLVEVYFRTRKEKFI
jgi:hypothetical protein